MKEWERKGHKEAADLQQSGCHDMCRLKKTRKFVLANRG